MSASQKIAELTVDDLKKTRKDELLQVMKDLVKELTSEGHISSPALQDANPLTKLLEDVSDLKNHMKTLATKNEITDLVKPLLEENVRLRKDFDEMQSEIKTLKDVITQQHKVIENLEKERRSSHVVITGTKLSNTDVSDPVKRREKALNVINAVDSTFPGDKVLSVAKLGKQGYNLPLLVKLDSAATAGHLLNNSSKLKDAEGYDKVFIRRDYTATEQKERSRLYQEYQNCKKSHEDDGKTVELKKGQLLLDGVVIDQLRTKEPFLPQETEAQ